MLDGAIIIPLQSLFWNLIFELAALLWIVDRALLNVGYFIMVFTRWVTEQAFAPLLGIIGDQTGVLVGPLFSIAMLVLGFTYMMAVFGKFEVVNFRSAVMWLLIAAMLYTFGPGLYLGMEDFRRLFAGGFYEAGIDAFNDADTASGLSAIGTTAGDTIAPPVDRFGPFLGGGPGASAVDGLDVAMAYVGADGYDVLAAAGSPHPIARIPYSQVQAGADGFFDPDTGPAAFHSMPDADRQASIGRAIQGAWRMFTVLFIIIFGIIEQLINFLMACAFAIAFFSMFVAVLFGFFVRTEPIAWGALQLIIELFIQSIINGLLMSLILGFVMVGANTANAILLLGAALVGLYLSWNLLKGCVNGLVNASQRIYKSFGAVTGGNIQTVQETSKSLNEAMLSAATGASVLAGGGSFVQAVGATIGDGRMAQTMNYAARMLGGEETLLGRAAEALGEGASARSLAGPLGGYMLGRDKRRKDEEERARQRRMAYRGEDDEARQDAVQSYRESGDVADLEEAFGPQQARRAQALADTFDDEEFDQVAQAVQRVRNDNPGMSPQSPNFLAKVRQELPSPLREMDAPALEAFADLFGAAPQASPYQRKLQQQQNFGSSEQEQALLAYRAGDSQALQDAFSPDDADRLARLMDSYDDDDFAQVIYALKAAQAANPDVPVGGLAHLQAAQQFLPQRLQAMPMRELGVMARALGGGAGQPLAYVGSKDRERDAAVSAYMEDNKAAALKDVFRSAQADDVMKLANEYERDDFEAVVQAVRQARTLDPDLEPGTPGAVRAARKQLPQRLRQMPSADLSAFSRAFGGQADVGTIAPSGPKNEPKPPRKSGLPSLEEIQRIIQESVSEQNAQGEWVSMDQLQAEAPRPQPYRQPVVPPALADGKERALGLDAAPPPLTLDALEGIKPPQKKRLEAMGLGTLDKLGVAPVSLIAQAAKVDEDQARDWRTEARVALRAQEQSRQAQVQQVQSAVRVATPSVPIVDLDAVPSSSEEPPPYFGDEPTFSAPPMQSTAQSAQLVSVVSRPAGTPITNIRGLGPARLAALQAQGVQTMEQLVQAQPAVLAQSLKKVSEAQVAGWQAEARQRLASSSAQVAVPVAPAAPPPNLDFGAPPSSSEEPPPYFGDEPTFSAPPMQPAPSPRPDVTQARPVSPAPGASSVQSVPPARPNVTQARPASPAPSAPSVQSAPPIQSAPPPRPDVTQARPANPAPSAPPIQSAPPARPDVTQARPASPAPSAPPVQSAPPPRPDVTQARPVSPAPSAPPAQSAPAPGPVAPSAQSASPMPSAPPVQSAPPARPDVTQARPASPASSAPPTQSAPESSPKKAGGEA